MGLLQIARSHCSLPRLIFPVQFPCREKINFSRMHCAMCTVVRLYTSSVFMHGRRGFSFRKAASEMPPPDRTNVRCGRALTDWTRRSTYHAKYTELNRRKHRIVLMYMSSAAILCVGLSYAAVPLYRMYCQATGYGGTTRRVEDLGTVLESMVRADDRMLTVRFSGDTSGSLQWKFKPQQSEIKLAPGETALAFYTAENLTDSAIIGISTYNVIPFDAGQYFNKIQCFCFEEQRLNPREQVDMPVFFYIDPEFTEDPAMAKVDTITLAYTFFEAKESHSPVAVGHG